jgi:hypothetical protein
MVYGGPESSTLYDMMMKDKSLLEIGEENIAKEKARLKRLREREEKRSKTKEVLEFLEEEETFRGKIEKLEKLTNEEKQEMGIGEINIGYIKNVILYRPGEDSLPTVNIEVSYLNLTSVGFTSVSYLRTKGHPYLEMIALLPKQKLKLIALLDKFFKWQKIAKEKKIKLDKKIGVFTARYMLFANGLKEPINPLPIPVYYKTINNQPVFKIHANLLNNVEMMNNYIDRSFSSVSFSNKNARLLRKMLTQKEIERAIKRKKSEDTLFN